MKRKFLFICLIVCLAQAFSLLAAEPGGTRTWYGYFTVKDENGVGISGVSVELIVTTWYGDELNPQYYTCYQTGVTGSGGYVTLSCSILIEYASGLESMWAYMTDSRYTVLSSQDTYTYTNQAIWPVFNVVYDQDGDLINDNLEAQLAQKFSPVLHKHSYDLQQGLSNVDWILTGRSSLKAYNQLGQTVYNSSVANPGQLHVYLGTGDRDSFGSGEMWTAWRLDIQDTYRYQSAPSGQRPLYYHVYKSGNYYYVQYWAFWSMNDIQAQTVNHTWHEGDFEHVSIKVSMSSLDPVAVNFYRHEGGRTVSPSNCWWSSSNSLTYSGLSQGYSTSRTHLHIWVAANAHAMYNRYHEVYSFTASGPDFCSSLDPENYIDNVDYDPAGYNLYFPYDYLENLGEFAQSTSAHGYSWFAHYNPAKSMSKSWLCFVGNFGQYWAETCFGFPAITKSPLSPIFDVSGKPAHEWTSFSEYYSPYGFGNPLSLPPFTSGAIYFTSDPTQGD